MGYILGLDWLSGWWMRFSYNELYIIDFLLLCCCFFFRALRLKASNLVVHL